VEDVAAGHVARHQIGRELDTLELAAEHPTERTDQQGLAEPGHALDEHVTAGEDRQQHLLDDLVLAEQHAVDLVAKLGECVGALLHGHDRVLEVSSRSWASRRISSRSAGVPRVECCELSRRSWAWTSSCMTLASSRPVRAAIAWASGCRPRALPGSTRSRRRSSAQAL